MTVVVVDGIDVMIACWNAWRQSDSFSSLHAPCKSCRLVISEPPTLQLDPLFERVCMSDLMWLSLVDRATKRWVMVSSWCGWSVMVGGGFSIWGSCISGGVVWWRGCCKWLVGGDVDVVVCFVRGRVLGCGLCPWRYSLGVR